MDNLELLGTHGVTAPQWLVLQLRVKSLGLEVFRVVEEFLFLTRRVLGIWTFLVIHQHVVEVTKVVIEVVFVGRFKLLSCMTAEHCFTCMRGHRQPILVLLDGSLLL